VPLLGRLLTQKEDEGGLRQFALHAAEALIAALPLCAAAGLGLILLHHASSRIRCCWLRAANENVLDKHKATRLKPITTGPSLAPPGSVPARISHTNRRIGPPNQRKFLCRNDFTQVRGAPEEIGRDGAGVEAELNRPGTVDHGVKCRTVDLLLQVRIGNPRNRRDALFELLGADIDLRRPAEIQDLRDHVGRLEVKKGAGESGRKDSSTLADVVPSWRAPVLLLLRPLCKISRKWSQLRQLI
jgi:hypothetical protein